MRFFTTIGNIETFVIYFVRFSLLKELEVISYMAAIIFSVSRDSEAY